MGTPLRPNLVEQDRFFHVEPHGQVTSDTQWKILQVPAGRKLRIDAVKYLNPTGLAEDTTNVFNTKLLKGASTILASHSTDSDLQVADAGVAADTFLDLTLSSTDADLVLDGDDAAANELSALLDEGGSATLPAGRFVIYGRWV